ncbi:MAG: hypothetical protein WC955_00930 [Elusimicrobiota bacterium]
MSNKVGIGTETPLSQLDVNGSVAIGTYAGANAGPSNGMIVSGNVGVGTNNPVEKLQVAGNIKITGYKNLYFIDGGYTHAIGQYQEASDWLAFGSAKFRWFGGPDFSSDQVIAYMDSNSFVLSQSLSVKQSATFNYDKGNYDFNVKGDNDDNLIFADASADKVGIGTSSPDGKLDINGSLVLRTASTPSNPPSGTVVLWFDGTDLKAKNSSGDTKVIADWS